MAQIVKTSRHVGLTWKDRVAAARGAARTHWRRMGAETLRMASIVNICLRGAGIKDVERLLQTA